MDKDLNSKVLYKSWHNALFDLISINVEGNTMEHVSRVVAWDHDRTVPYKSYQFQRECGVHHSVWTLWPYDHLTAN